MPRRNPGYYVPFFNPFDTLAELDRACRSKAASTWKAEDRMPFWARWIAEGSLSESITDVDTVQEAVYVINDFLEDHPKAIITLKRRRMSILERIA